MKRLAVIVIAAVGVLALVGLAALFRDRGPSYQGKSARAWAKELGRPHQSLSITIQALQQVGPAAVPHLSRLLQRQQSSWQIVYGRLLSKLPDPITQRLPPPDIDAVNIRTRAAATLGKLGPCATSAVPALVRALMDPEAQVRSAAAVTLGQIGRAQSELAVAALVATALHDPYRIVRQNACMALGEIGSRAAAVIPQLEEIASAGGAEMTPFALAALKQIKADAASASAENNSNSLLLTNRLHLGIAGKPEWQEFASQMPDAHRLDLRFNARKNSSESTLFIRQRDVKYDWRIELNGRAIGKLQLNEADLEHTVGIPSGALADGENTLSIIPPTQIDNIVLGPVTLRAEPVATLLQACTVAVQVTDADTRQPLPCRLTIVNESGALAPVYAEPATNLAIRTGVVYTPNGAARLNVLPGKYRIFASRGFEYSVHTQAVTVAHGDAPAIEMRINREVDTSGLVAADTHVHTLTFSGHGDATIDERVITLAGEGIELPIVTEHNLHADYAKPARRMRVDPYFTPVTGNEVTTRKGHFNAFPIQLNAPVPDSKIEDWPKLMQAIRQTPSVQVVILNHPRDLHSNFRPFAQTNFNALTGQNRRGFEFDFDAVELVNSGALQSDLMRLYRDWFSLLNYGLKIASAGGSDSHDVTRYIVGQGRTYIRANDTTPANINIVEASRTFREGRTYVSMGLLTLLGVDNKFEGGDLATGLGESIRVDVHVLSPSWSNADRVELFANGQKIREETTEYQEDIPRILWKIPRPRHDVFLVAIATGPGITAPFWAIPKPYQPSSPEWTPRVIGSSAPIWIDADGDGRFTPAREIARSLVQKHEADLAALLKELSNYDAAVTSQAASLIHASGTGVASPELTTLLAGAAEAVRRAFKEFADAHGL